MKQIYGIDNAIAIKPDLADAYNNRGNCLRELLNYQEAIINYDKAILAFISHHIATATFRNNCIGMT